MFGPEIHFIVAVPDGRRAWLIEQTLQEQGFFNLTRVDNGLTGLDLIKQKPDSVFLSSWTLPGLSGLDLLYEIRHFKACKDTAFIFVGSAPKEDSLIRARYLGVDTIVDDPVTPEELWSRIQDTLGRRSENLLWPQDLEIKASRLLEDGQAHEAIEYFEAVLTAARKRSAGLHTEIGLVLIRQGKTAAATASLEAAVADDPLSARAQAALGQTYLETGRHQEAVRTLVKAYNLAPNNVETQLNLCESLIAVGQNSKAEAFLLQCLTRNPKDIHYFNRLAMAFRKKGDFDRAVNIYLKLVQQNQRDEHLLFNLGRCLFDAGRLNQAAAVLRQALKVNPDLPGPERLLEKISQSTS